MSKRSHHDDHTLSPAPKRARQLDAAAALAPSLDTWLKPSSPVPQPLLACSPPLHASSSTFISLALSFVPPSSVRTAESLRKEALRAVHALDVVRLVGADLLASNEGCFAHGEGRATSRRGAERARDPDHKMWAVRTLALAEGRDGTRGDGDYQLLETSDDDGERFGGERVLRTLRETGAVDVLCVVCRWFGGDMLGPARFTLIATVAHTSSKELVAMLARRELRTAISALDAEIVEMRATIVRGEGKETAQEGEGKTAVPTYDDIDDVSRLQRLLRAREMTQKSLEKRVGWAALEIARVQAEAEALAREAEE
ncbi:hypothetical protein CC85DRAFT_285415 [Cutaneotrichosporon oleaginosum]|uniref:Impact N-terminal domain-containing protein n=1 Tax=Cutaneotrichosporon oleaginosum TaxID=879819 RepID=A0A0J0XN37_9TREE|nr:uncharacterized protein CC85DRAFT_285415 [Cutaneotrichosporon oleaginosum]KLT42507.1 hypothetical protein CC85DRAFT_285415 [Cutaneotrichosporon oleaginosum]TXT07779.1 hypothetical protein COLE_04703 [Cutaneotrichosporon oleaginosum]